jgi:hypothetical protein
VRRWPISLVPYPPAASGRVRRCPCCENYINLARAGLSFSRQVSHTTLRAVSIERKRRRGLRVVKRNLGIKMMGRKNGSVCVQRAFAHTYSLLADNNLGAASICTCQYCLARCPVARLIARSACSTTLSAGEKREHVCARRQIKQGMRNLDGWVHLKALVNIKNDRCHKI